jgi:hypothetical protein
MSDVVIEDLRSTIIPRSDQLNSEQLLTGPMTVTVSGVSIGSTDEQPITVHYEGEAGRPFKPCKTMRKLLVFAWGQNGNNWVGKSMTLYADPNVKFGGVEVGGIRISHMTDIDGDIKVSLTATKGKKALHVVKRLELQRASTVDHAALIDGAETVGALKDAFRIGYRATRGQEQKDALKAKYDARMAVLNKQTMPGPDYLAAMAQIEQAADRDALALLVEGFRDLPDSPEKDALLAAYRARDEALSWFTTPHPGDTACSHSTTPPPPNSPASTAAQSCTAKKPCPPST